MMWAEYELHRLAKQFVSGGTPSTKEPEYWNGDIPWITGADFADGEVVIGRRHISREGVRNSATNIVAAGSVLLVTRTGVGKIAVAPVDIAISQDITGIVPKEGVNSKYLFYAIRFYMGVILAAQRGATIKGVTRNDVISLPIPLPTPLEQRRIVEILDQADRLRRRRTEADTKISRVLPTLFHKMFGDLISNSCGWNKEPVTKLCVKEDGIKCGPFGTQLSNKEYQQEGVSLWGIKHVNAGFVLKTKEFISQEKAEYLKAYSILPGDIIMTRKGTVGNCSVYPEDYPTGIMHSDLLRIRVNRNKASPCFLAFQLQLSPAVVNQIATISGGAVMAGINVTRLKSLLVHVPPLEKQVQFEQHAQETQRLLERVHNTKARISRLFDVLLHRAFTGDLTAKWREGHMKELLTEMEHQQSCLETTK